MPRKAPAPYHHGDLRRVLLDASLALIDAQGVAAWSLREVAREAGVSHNAPYHHFADKGALLAAIAEEGFAELGREIRSARALGADPAARLAACGIAYVRFALQSAATFRVMFRPELCTSSTNTPVEKTSEPAFQALVETVVECQAAGLWPPGDPMPLVLTAWSAVHGLASLWLDGPLQANRMGFGLSPEVLAEMVVRTLVSMLKAAHPPARGRARQKAAPPRPRRASLPRRV
jgi:AcrR family transcriptional regulator